LKFWPAQRTSPVIGFVGGPFEGGSPPRSDPYGKAGDVRVFERKI